MARHCKPIEETLRWEIYCEFRKWSEAKGTTCNPHSFWKRVLPTQGYTMARGTFLREWNRLVREDGLITIEPTTLQPIIVDLELVPRSIAARARTMFPV